LPAASRTEVASGREDAAVNTAREAVLRQPLSVEALAVLARSTVVSNPQMSSEALTQAAGLGWRDAAIQASVIENASLTKNWDVVAPRLVALTNLNALEVIDPAVLAMESASHHAAQIAAAFADNGLAWFKFVKWMREKGFEKQSEALLAETPAYEREDSCARLGLTANEFVRAGRVDFAAELIDTRCQNFLTSASSALTIDKSFGNRDRGPFEWQLVSNSGVSVRIETVGGMTVVEVANSDPLPRTIAQRIVRARALQSGTVGYFKKMGPNSSDRNILPVEFDCVAVQHKSNEKAILSPDKILMGNCSFVKVNFQLGTGRFQIWTEDLSRVKSLMPDP
jgi:hypothetical protein